MFSSPPEANGKGSAAEFQRIQRELKDVTDRISAVWTNQGRMQLNAEALSLASEELNRLAKQKQDLEKYLAQVDPKACDPHVFHRAGQKRRQQSASGCSAARLKRSWSPRQNFVLLFGRALMRETIRL